jgi:transposase
MIKYQQQKHIVKLSVREKLQLRAIINKGSHKSREIRRAQVLLKSSQGMKDADIAYQLGTTTRSVERIRLRYSQGKLKTAIYDAPRSGNPGVVTDEVEAQLVAVTCSNPPEGASRWTLTLLRQRLLKDKTVKHISKVAIFHHLNNRGLKPWREKNVVYSQTNSGIHTANGTSAETV